MNKRGVETETGFSMELILVVVVFIVLGGCAYKYVSSQECPAGFKVIQDVSEPLIYTFCGSLETMEETKTRCCQRKNNPSELCKYDLGKKEFILCKDVQSFDEYYKARFICEEPIPCGTVGVSEGKEYNINCAGVYCEEHNVCAVQKEGGKWVGKCVSKLQLEDKEVFVLSDGLTQCGLRSGPNVLGTGCDNEELKSKYNLGKGNYCVLEDTRFSCKGGFNE